MLSCVFSQYLQYMSFLYFLAVIFCLVIGAVFVLTEQAYTRPGRCGWIPGATPCYDTGDWRRQKSQYAAQALDDLFKRMAYR